mmetsp:Transcript_121057/g.337839  ORF Transcript_121057/g.337839 Transcript_121057/m.337839 type:complete len:273 (+) Transcript_121057:83-901(+)
MLLYKLWGAKGANSECLPSIRRLRMSSRSSFSFSSAISLVRMCLRHMGVTRTAIPKPIANLVVSTWCLVWLATAATPPSKQCSQENPMRIPRAFTSVWMAFAPALESSEPEWASSRVSKPKTARPAKAETASAMITRPITEVVGKIAIVPQNHRVPQSMHQAKAIAVPLRPMSKSRGTKVSSFRSPCLALARTRPQAMAAKATPIPKIVMMAFRLCSASGGSRPSSFGRMPEMAKRSTFTNRNDIDKLEISFSASSTSSWYIVARRPARPAA